MRPVRQGLQNGRKLLQTLADPHGREAIRMFALSQEVPPVKPAEVSHADPHWAEALLVPAVWPRLLRFKAVQEAQLRWLLGDADQQNTQLVSLMKRNTATGREA